VASRNRSAGILLFRRTAGVLEVLLAHPGGPFWARKDVGAWTLPKGIVEEGEDPLAAALREFEEEIGTRPTGEPIPLGSIRQRGGKHVLAWACEGDLDADAIRSNIARLEWPRGSGRFVDFPEVDRAAWFSLDHARERINPAQAALLDRLVNSIPS
jgi:predicted NUDIX family NTP pyrophosphohydrolase